MRRSDHDVTDTIRTTDPIAVRDEVARIYVDLYGGRSPRLLRHLFADVARFYGGRDPGYHACDTIKRWPSVRKGEERNIFPYQENADVMFNSALAYELSALKPLAEPLLRQLPFGTAEYVEAKRLLTFLGWFLPIESEFIPDNSLLREFIGNSILRNFTVWSNHHQA